MSHNNSSSRMDHTTTTVQVQMIGRTILDCIMHKLPSSRKYYRVSLIVPDNGIPIIEYHHANSPKKPKKSIQFVDVLFADRKHDLCDKFAFSVYTTEKTITFIAQDETTMNDWLTKVKECHAKLYPEFKRYDTIFEATLLDKGLAKTMSIQGPYRIALCKESLDLIPLHHKPPQPPTPNQRFSRRHPLLNSETIELVLRSIRRCGHTDCNFYIESGRHSKIGEGDLWMALSKKAVARQLHELLLATMKQASVTEEQFLYKAPRSRSGSSSQSNQVLAAANLATTPTTNPGHSTNITATTTPNTATNIAQMYVNNNNLVNNDDEYLPMA